MSYSPTSRCVDACAQLRQKAVEDLAESMQRRGLLQPVILQSAATGYYLVAGHHRLEVARKLKWETIRAHILEGVERDRLSLHAASQH
jgi:ParB-like chromosome segregation protein Spo0J